MNNLTNIPKTVFAVIHQTHPIKITLFFFLVIWLPAKAYDKIAQILQL